MAIKKNKNKIAKEDDFCTWADLVNSQNNVQLIRVYRLKAILNVIRIYKRV